MRSPLQLIGLAVVSTAVVSVYQHGSATSEKLTVAPIEASPQKIAYLMTTSELEKPSFKPLKVSQPRKLTKRAITDTKPQTKSAFQSNFAKL